jgi:hypothetical protein
VICNEFPLSVVGGHRGSAAGQRAGVRTLAALQSAVPASILLAVQRRPREIDIDINKAHSSRIYDYFLGGTDNFAVDREAAQSIFSSYPGGPDGARTDARINRSFLRRAVRFMVGEMGIRQVLDIGTGIPNHDNAHAIAHGIAPESRVVYVDNDPIVLAHAHRILRDRPSERTDFIAGDLRTPDQVLDDASKILDFDQPVALLLVGIMHVVSDEAGAYDFVRTLTAALPSGSHVAISQLTRDSDGQSMDDVMLRSQAVLRTEEPLSIRTRTAVEQFFDGLELLEPGLVQGNHWRPEDGDSPVGTDYITPLYAGVARIP